MLASELYAIQNGTVCEGKDQCHWCRGACSDKWRHDDVTFHPFSKSPQLAKYPAGHFICAGCWLWRRPSITVRSPGGSFRDRQCLLNHSTYITETEITVLQIGSGPLVYPILQNPPLRFCLSISTEPKVLNLLHLQQVNDLTEIHADTKLIVNINNHPVEYSIYDLEEGLKYGTAGKLPGARSLIDFLGKVPMEIDQTKPINKYYMPTKERRNEEALKRMKRVIN